MIRRHITIDFDQKSLIHAEFERRSWMCEGFEYTLADWGRHVLKLYKAPSRKNIKRILKNSGIGDTHLTCKKFEKSTEIGHQSTQKLNIIYENGFGTCIPSK